MIIAQLKILADIMNEMKRSDGFYEDDFMIEFLDLVEHRVKKLKELRKRYEE